MSKCEQCDETGWYGDNGPGIKGNREYQRCECGCAGDIEQLKYWDDRLNVKIIEQLSDKRDALKALIAEAVEFVEMAGDDGGYCQVCKSNISEDHLPDCRLAAWLKKARKK